MKAIVYHEYGAPEVLRYEDIATPTPGDDQVLIRVRAAAANAMDRYFVKGVPYLGRIMTGLRKPRLRLGVDVAGEVEAIGRNVTALRVGDAVFGTARGAFAEYVCAREDKLAPKPAGVTFEQAASAPVAGLTALQGLRDKGRIRPGQKVLITGAAGGVGSFAVQIARSLGAHVAAVCSTRNVDAVKAMGADRVIDYTREDFTRSAERYDLILSVAGSRSAWACRRVMTPAGILVWAGGPSGRWLGPLAGAIATLAASPFIRQSVGMFVAQVRKDDLIVLGELMETGKVKPVIGLRCTLRDASQAIRYLEEGHARGKAVITVA